MANYCDNKELERLVILYNSTNDKDAGNKIAEYFEMIAAGMADRYFFKLPDKENAVQDCIVRMLCVLPKYEASKGKAFNFFSTVAHNELRQAGRQFKLYKQFGQQWAPGAENSFAYCHECNKPKAPKDWNYYDDDY